MELIESIYKLYQDAGEIIVPLFPDKLRITCEKHIFLQTGNFSVSLAIIVLTRILHEDDYGLVFSTNAQIKSHYSDGSNFFAEGFYLVTDLGTGDGRIIDDTDELNYLPFDSDNVKRIWEIIKDFTTSRIDSVKSILLDRYPELADK